VLNYFGQGAWLLSQKDGYLGNKVPFFAIMPEWFLMFGIIIATMATIIASQALISGSFTLISDAMKLKLWPASRVRYPSESKGQMYIPAMNWILMAGSILVVVIFKESSAMEGAYGLAITVNMLMTTSLLVYYFSTVKKSTYRSILLASIFFSLETLFLASNLHKFEHGGWFTFMIAFIFFFLMFVLLKARKLRQRHTEFVDLRHYEAMLKDLQDDNEVPKEATNLVYLAVADSRRYIDSNIIYSIFKKRPKRADVYWFLHLQRTDEPYTLNYEVSELVDDKIIKVTINIGFRIQPRSELYFKKIIRDLVAKKELNLHIRPDGSTKYNTEPDFKFIIIEKFLSVENEFTLHEGLLLNTYFFLKHLGQSDEKAFGLDKSDVLVEQVPLIYQPVQKIELARNY